MSRRIYAGQSIAQPTGSVAARGAGYQPLSALLRRGKGL